MLGLMQDQPLSIASLIKFAERHRRDGEIVSWGEPTSLVVAYTPRGPRRRA